MRPWIRLKRDATQCQSLQKECVHAFGGPNVDRRSHWVDKVPQQTNFWFPKTRGLPSSPFQEHAVRSGRRQGPPQQAIDLEYSLILM
jgi:hypothetical protein